MCNRSIAIFFPTSDKDHFQPLSIHLGETLLWGAYQPFGGALLTLVDLSVCYYRKQSFSA
jgi:hypothetical protein